MNDRSACVAAAGLRVATAFAFVASALPAAAQSPDTALVNGKIITLDERSTIAEALAVRDGTIVAVGRSADIRGLAGPATRIIDLGGTVLAGSPAEFGEYIADETKKWEKVIRFADIKPE